MVVTDQGSPVFESTYRPDDEDDGNEVGGVNEVGGRAGSENQNHWLKPDMTSSNGISQFVHYPFGVTVMTALSYLLFGFSVSIMNSVDYEIVRATGWCDNESNKSEGKLLMWNPKSNTEPLCELAKKNLALVNSILFVGAMLGCIIGTKVAAGGGRRQSIKTAFVLYAIGGAMCLVLPSVTSLCCSRFVSGVAVGITTVTAPILIAEMAKPSQRGFLGTLGQSFIGLGIFVSALLALPMVSPWTSTFLQANFSLSPMMNETYWYYIMSAPPIVISILGLSAFSFIYVHDTPEYYVGKYDYDNAHRVLYKIHRDEGDSDMRDCTVASSLIDITAKRHAAVLESRIKTRDYSFKEIFTVPMCQRYIRIGIIVAVVQQASGINCVISSSNQIFAENGMSRDGLALASLFLSLGNFLATCSSSFLIQFASRDAILRQGSLFMSFCVLPAGFFLTALEAKLLPSWEKYVTWGHLSLLTACALILYAVMFSLTLGPVTWIFLGELFPSHMRKNGLVVCGLVNWASSAVAVYAGGRLSTQGKLMLFGTICLMSYFAMRDCFTNDKNVEVNSWGAPLDIVSQSEMLVNRMKNVLCEDSSLTDISKDLLQKTTPNCLPPVKIKILRRPLERAAVDSTLTHGSSV